MTNEEAIYLLRNTAWIAPSLEPIDEAIEMACDALRKTEPQFDKDINVRSKDEPKLSEIPTSKCHYEPKTDCPWK